MKKNWAEKKIGQEKNWAEKKIWPKKYWPPHPQGYATIHASSSFLKNYTKIDLMKE